MEFRPTASKLLQNSSSTFKVSVWFLCDDVLGDVGDDVHDIEVCASSTFEVSVCFLCDDVLGEDGDDVCGDDVFGDDGNDVQDIEVSSSFALEVVPEGHVGRSD